VDIIKRLDPPGRFLAPVKDSDRNCKQKDGSILWQDVGDKKARAKASQCLREKKLEANQDELPSTTKIAKSKKGAYTKFEQNEKNFSIYPGEFHGETVTHSESRKSFPVYSRGYDQNKVYEKRRKMYHQNECTIMRESAHIDHTHFFLEGSIDIKNAAPSISHMVSPDNEEIKRNRDYHSEDYFQHANDNFYTPKNDLSWVQSFYSLETQIMEDEESMSLSSMQISSINNGKNNENSRDLHRTSSWTSSEVRSELTDNSHIDDL
jgi:hypothetical protein